VTSMCRIYALAMVSAVVLAAPALAQDKKGSAPPAATPKAADSKAAKVPEKGGEERKVILENEKVLVTENRYKPGAASAMRERGVRVSRSLTDGTIERTSKDGKKEVLNLKAGEVRYQAKETFSQKNIGKSDYVVYTVTLK
jgi:hypothetical protein